MKFTVQKEPACPECGDMDVPGECPPGCKCYCHTEVWPCPECWGDRVLFVLIDHTISRKRHYEVCWLCEGSGLQPTDHITFFPDG